MKGLHGPTATIHLKQKLNTVDQPREVRRGRFRQPIAAAGQDIERAVPARNGSKVVASGVDSVQAREGAGHLQRGALEMPLAPLWGWLILFEIPRMSSVAGGAVVLLTLVWYLGRESRVRS